MSYSDVDTAYGLEQENQFYEVLKNKFDNTLLKTNNKYELFDFIGDNCFIELKSRRNEHDKYKDTMISCNKLLFARHCGKDCYFVFNFTDGLFYYKFDKMDYDTGVIRSAYGGRDDRGKDEKKPYCYINIKLLRKI